MSHTTMSAAPAETTSRCDPRKVQVGSTFSRHSFGTVTHVYGDQIGLRNAAGLEWQIGAKIMEQEFCFADQHDSEESVSRTRAIEVMTEHSHTAMTICFRKQVDPKAVAAALEGGRGSRETDKTWLKKVADLLDGEERVMVGYHQNGWDEHRRLKFTETGKGPRLVDPRTLNWVVVARTKFTVKA